MAVRLFKLKDVPDDEAEDVRLLLREHDISFYETHGGGFGIGTPAIWLHDNEMQDHARALIDDYQQRRSVEQQAEYVRLKADGEQMTFFDRFKEHPVVVIVLLSVALFILYVSLSPFLGFGQ